MHDRYRQPDEWDIPGRPETPAPMFCIDCGDVEVFVFDSRCPACAEIERAKLDTLVPVRSCVICGALVMANYEAAACSNCNTPYPVPDYLKNTEASNG